MNCCRSGLLSPSISLTMNLNPQQLVELTLNQLSFLYRVLSLAGMPAQAHMDPIFANG